MSMENDRAGEDEMRPEYDLRGGVRGKYYKQYSEGTNVVLLDPDVAAVFRDSASVNEALRVLIKAAEQLHHPILRNPEQLVRRPARFQRLTRAKSGRPTPWQYCPRSPSPAACRPGSRPRSQPPCCGRSGSAIPCLS